MMPTSHRIDARASGSGSGPSGPSGPSSATAPEQQTVSFPYGLPGFEGCRNFVVLAADQAPFQWLSAIDGPAAAFLAIDPKQVLPTYRQELNASDLERLGADSETALLWLAIVRLESDGAVSVNLRAPIVINPATMRGQQVMPQNCLYPIRHVLIPSPQA